MQDESNAQETSKKNAKEKDQKKKKKKERKKIKKREEQKGSTTMFYSIRLNPWVSEGRFPRYVTCSLPGRSILLEQKGTRMESS